MKQQVIDKIESIRALNRAAQRAKRQAETAEGRANIGSYIKANTAKIERLRFNHSIYERGELRSVAIDQARRELEELIR